MKSGKSNKGSVVEKSRQSTRKLPDAAAKFQDGKSNYGKSDAPSSNVNTSRRQGSDTNRTARFLTKKQMEAQEILE